MRWAERLTALGSIIALLGGLLFVRGPAVNERQLAFRIGVVVIGLGLFVAGRILKAKDDETSA